MGFPLSGWPCGFINWEKSGGEHSSPHFKIREKGGGGVPIDSLGFVYLFLPASMAAYYSTSNRYKNFVLLVVSLVFYGMLFPTMLPMDEVTAAVQEAAEKLLDGRQKMLPETVEELLHSVACKAAIKAHDTTSLPEMEQLVEVIRQDRDVRFCPHGRPVSITMTRSELERRFGRLV